MELSIPVLGKVNVEPAILGCWEFQLHYLNRPVRLDFTVPGEILSQKSVDMVASFVADLAAFDERARRAISSEQEQGGEYTVQEYIDHHLEQFTKPQLLQCLGTGDAATVSPALFLSKLRLHRIGLYPEDPEEPAIFDYTIDREMTDYLIVVRFNLQGKALAVDMES
jgi:hypothetical protein